MLGKSRGNSPPRHIGFQVVVGAMTSILLLTPSFGSNMIMNPEFEQSLTGWTTMRNQLTGDVTVGNYDQDSDSEARARNWLGPAVNYFYQDVMLRSLDASFGFTMRATASPNAAGDVRLEYLTDGGTVLGYTVWYRGPEPTALQPRHSIPLPDDSWYVFYIASLRNELGDHLPSIDRTRVSKVRIKISATTAAGVGEANTYVDQFSLSDYSQPTGDLNGDGCVSLADIMLIISKWATAYPPYDLDSNGNIGLGDIIVVIAHWGEGCV